MWSSAYFCRVCKIEHIILVIHYSIHGVVCFQFTQFPRDGWENILLCLIIIIKSEVWTIIHRLGLGHQTMVCAVCFFIFLWKMSRHRLRFKDTKTEIFPFTITWINSSPHGQNDRHFDWRQCIFVNENDRIPIRMSLKFVPMSPIDNKLT